MEDIIRLSARDVSFKYPDGTSALKGINLDIKKGEFIGILGSNGSGKTTLLKAMDGILKGIEGNVYLDSVDIKRLTPRDIYRKIGLVFQNPDDQLFAPTLYEDIAFGPINMGFDTKEIETRVLNALKDVDLSGLEKKSIHNLSYGQKKRACIAGLLAMGHEILLLDEPTAGLDPMGEYKMMNILQRLNKENSVTAVMATHSVDLVPLFLDRLYILSKGRIIRQGSSEEVFTSPEDMEDIKLRLPQIAELIYRLKHEEMLPFDRIPLTVGEARRELIKTIEVIKEKAGCEAKPG